jgi:RNA polymerase sigma factor (sigma-70 family)
MNRLRSSPFPASHLREALRSGLDALPDAELLDRYARYADHPAFEVLVRRHGPMVFGVCRRTLTNAADAEDAFQAAFLVLIRKARGIRRADRLGPWLYGVAIRVARKARLRAARLAEYRRALPDAIPDPAESGAVPDWLPILDAELAALPAKYRDPLVLCELQGASRTDAARRLGLREGTLSSRLSRGRDLLRRRLLKHGTLLPMGGIAALFSASGLSRATVPTALLARTIELAKLVTGAATGTVPVAAAQLTDGVLKGMFVTKLRLAGGVVVALVLAVGLAAARPGEVPGDGRDEPGGAPPNTEEARNPRTAPGSPTDPTAPVARQPGRQPGPHADDREAVQGLWRGSLIEMTTAAREQTAQFGKLQRDCQSLFVVGDTWWHIWCGGGTRLIKPYTAKLYPSKRPKWLDLLEHTPVIWQTPEPELHLYGIDEGDRLRVYASFTGRPRPAEFDFNDEESKLYALTYRRQMLRKPAGEKELLGSWAQPVDCYKEIAGDGSSIGRGGGQYLTQEIPVARVEVYDSLIFVGNLSGLVKDEGSWLGGSYTLDASRNPPGIDIDLFNPIPGSGATKLYGSYERTADGLQFVLGLSGKRAERPMDFAPSTAQGAPDRLYFDLKRTRGLGEKLDAAPPPRAKNS